MSRTILLADDSVTIQKVVELTFVDQGVEVVAVGSGDDALERLESLDPDLVIADVHMPGADGLEVCRRVKSDRPETPVLLLVGTFEPFDTASVDDVGAEAFLKKPFDSQELLRISLELMDGDGGRQEEGGGVMTTEQPTPESAPETPEPRAEAAESVEATEPVEASAATPEPPVAEAPAVVSSGNGLADEDVERIARRVVELMSDKTVRDVAWEVVPELAELLIRDRLRELENQTE